MKFLIIIISVSTSLFYSYPYVGGQSLDNPIEYYKKLTFDATLRGSFNLSNCIKELMNCFEFVRPEMLCDAGQTIHDTVCGALKKVCHDYYGPYDSFSYRWVIFEQYCRDWQYWT